MIYITSYSCPARSITEAIKKLGERGFRNIELTGGTEFDEYSEEKLVGLFHDDHVHFLLHNYFPPQENDFVLNLASGDGKIKARTFELINQAISLSNRFSQNLYSMHAGFTFDRIPRKGKDGLFIVGGSETNPKKNFYDAVSWLAETVLSENFRLAVENAFPSYTGEPFSMLCTPDDIFSFLEFIDSYANIGFLLDLGHLNVAAHYLQFNKNDFLNRLITEFSHKIFELHLNRNEGSLDAHEISPVESFEVQFVKSNWDIFGKIPIVLEWHNEDLDSVYAEYLRITDYFRVA